MKYPTDTKGEVYRIDKTKFEATYQSESVEGLLGKRKKG